MDPQGSLVYPLRSRRNVCVRKVLCRPEHWSKKEKFQPWFHFQDKRGYPGHRARALTHNIHVDR